MDNLLVIVVGLLLIVLVFGTAFFVRKHGGFWNAVYGGPIELIGEVAAGTLKDGDSEFRVARVIRQDRPNLVIFRFKKSDSDGYYVHTLTLSSEQALELSQVLATAASPRSTAQQSIPADS